MGFHIGLEADRANKPQKTGTEWYAYHLISHLDKLHSTNQFHLYSRDELEGDLAKLSSSCESTVIPWKGKLWTQLALSWHLRKHPVDVLFMPAHTIPLFCTLPMVTTLHDVGFKRYKHLYPRYEWMYHDLSARIALSRTKKIITISHFSKQEIVDLYHADPDSISVVYNGISHDTYFPEENPQYIHDVLEKYQITKPYILYIGRKEEKKNISRMLEAFFLYCAKHPQEKLQFVLIGKPGYGYERFEKLIEESGFKDRVIQPGWVQDADMRALYCGAELFFFATLYEGFGLPILEAMACETPVITSDQNPHREVGGANAYYVNPRDVHDMEHALTHLLHDPSLQNSFAKHGRERSLTFTYQRCAQETLSVLEQCARNATIQS